MKRRIVSFALIAGFAGLLGVSPAAADDARLYATLTGAAERPGPGDPDAIGRVVITINDAANQICAAVQFTNATLPTTGMHIHLAPPTSPGPVVVGFSNPTTYQSYECRTVENEALLDDIAANPGKYYFNVHNQEYPGGFIRGQLQAV
ncbi:MAG TPA: CHRD domain-containing protein [Acidimicrobiales bacterium]|nr:CHRD domain-containing protein [Acidimicrobiales bacterium]